MKATTTYNTNPFNKATMKRFYSKYILLGSILLASVFGAQGVMGQTTVFTDAFGGTMTPAGPITTTTNTTFTTSSASPSTTYTYYATSANNNVNLSGGSLYIGQTSNTGTNEFVMGTLSSYSAPFTTTLSSNPGLVTWTFNMRHQSPSNSVFGTGSTSTMATILCSSNSSLISATGYLVAQTTDKTYSLYRFTTNGTGVFTLTSIIGPSTATAANTDYVSYKVTYNPTGNSWCLYVRDDGAGAFADPTTTATQVGSATADATYTGTAMSAFGFYQYKATSSAGKNIFLDNFTCTVTSAGTPAVALADNGTQIAAGNIITSATKQALLSFKLSNTGSAAGIVNTIAFGINGTATGSDLSNYKLYYSTSNLLSGAAQIGSTVTAGAAGSYSFTGLTQSIAATTGVGYFWITTDVAATPTAGHTVYVSALANTGITLASTSVTAGPTTIGGTQTIIMLPTVTTTTASSITTTGASAGGTVTATGGSAVTAEGTAYATTASPTTGTSDGTATPFTSTISGLTANTLYYYRAFATNTVGTTYGTQNTLTTLSLPPTIGTASAVTGSGFTANWTVPGAQGAASFTYTIEVSTNSGSFDANIVGGATVTSVASGSATQAISGLSPGTTYYYRVKAVNAGGFNASGISASFTTTATAPPTVATGTAGSITTTAATISTNNITSIGTASVTVSGVCWATSTGTETAAGSHTIDGATSATTYTSSVGSLTANTLYYLKAYATNSVGTSYGSEINFTTLPNAPTSSAGTGTSSTGFTANWTAPAGGAAAYTYTVLVSTTSGNYASPAFSQAGIASGTLTQAVTGLSSNTTYYYVVEAVNAGGTSSYSAEQTVTTTAVTSATDYFRSQGTGNWATAGTWQSSANGSTGWITSTLVPTSSAKGIDIPSGTTVTVAASLTSPAPTVIAGVQVEGTLAVASGQVLTLGGNISVNSGGNLTLTGSTAASLVTTGYVLTVTGTGQLTNGNTAAAITSSATTLYFTGGGTYNHTINGGTIPTANWTSSGASTVNITGTVATAPSGFNQTFNNVIWNCASQTAAAVVIGNTGLSITGNLNVAATNTGTLQITSGGGESAVTVGSYTQSGGTVFLFGANGRSFTSTGNFGMSGGTFDVSSVGATTTTLFIGGNLNQTAGAINNTGAGTITYNGSGAQTVTYSSVAATLNHTINNSAGVGSTGVSLGSALTTSGVLTLTAGKLTTTSTFLLNLTNTANTAISGGSASTYISGPVKWSLPNSLAGGTAYTIPVGAGSTYLPIILNPTTSSATSAQVQAFASSAGGSADGSTLSAISTGEYWSITGVAGLTSATAGITRPTSISPTYNAIGSCATQGGSYASAAGTAGTYGVTGSNAITIGAASKYLVFGTILCTTPTTAYNVTATSNSICNGSSVTIGLNGSQSGVTYKLYANAVATGVTAAGTGAAITFAAQSPGSSTTYTVYTTSAGGYCALQINGGTSSQAVTVTAAPTTSNAGTNQNGLGYPAVATLAGNAAVSGTGAWAIVSGGTGTFSNAASATSTFTPDAAGTYVLSWTISNAPCTASTSNVQLIFTTCTPPTITTQPSTGTQSIAQNGTATALTVATSAGSPTYQWYKNAAASNSGGTLLSGANGASYTPLTTTVGVLYYYCIITAGGCSSTTNVSGSITITAPVGGCTIVGYDYNTTSYPNAMPSNTTATYGSGTGEFSLSDNASTTSQTICATSSVTGVSIGSSSYVEIDLTANSASSTINSLILTGCSNSSSSTAAAGIVFSSAYPFSLTSVTGALTTSDFLNYNSAWSNNSVSVPAGTKSLRIYRQIYYNSGTGAASTSSGSGFVAYGANQTIRLASAQPCITASCNNPTLTTQAVSSIAATTATGNGTITALGDGVTTSGVCWKTSAGATTADSKTTTGPTTAIAYTGSLTSLTANTTYYVKAYASYSGCSTGYGNEVSFITLPGQPTIAAGSNILANSFTANWTAPTQGAASFTYTLEYGTDNTFTTKTIVSGISSGSLSSAISSLSPSTTYYYRVKANNASGDGAYTAAYATVNTPALTTPTVTTQAVSSISYTTATGNGNTTNNGGSLITASGVCWSTTSGSETIAGSHTTDGGTSTGAFTSSMTALTGGTTYYVKAYATNAQGTSYGAEVSFTTTALTAPTVTTQAVSAIGTTIAIGNGNITATCGSSITVSGVCWSTTSGSETTGGSHTTDGGTSIGAFASSITGLTPGTTYYVKAYATNAQGTSYGVEVSFTTLKAPVTQATSINFTSVASTNMTINWTRGNGADVAVFVSASASAISNPVDGNTYTANAAFGSGTQLGGSGYFCVYNGTGTSVAITGLSAATTYYVQAFEYNGTTTQIMYYTSTATGNPNNQLTPTSTVPTLTTQAVTAIAATVATGNGTVTGIGGSNILAASSGVCWNTSTNPTIANSKTTTGPTGTTTGAYTQALSGLTGNTLYYLKAYATNSQGTGYGNEVTFVTLPSPPTIGTANSIALTSFTANWTANASPGNQAYTYTVEVDDDPAFGSINATQTGIASGTLSYNFTGLTNGTTYYYRVKAVNSQGVSAYTATSAAVLLPIDYNYQTETGESTNWPSSSPGSETQYNVTTGTWRSYQSYRSSSQKFNGSYSVYFNNSASYIISPNLTAGASTLTCYLYGSGKTCQILTSTDGTTWTSKTTFTATGSWALYTYTINDATVHYVKFLTASSSGLYIDDILISPLTATCPATTVRTALNVGASSFMAVWHPTACSIAHTYSLDYSTDPTFASGVTTVSSISDTTYTIPGLIQNTTYYYRVYVVNDYGTSAFSNNGNATTMLTANQRVLTVTIDAATQGTVLVKGVTVTSSTAIYCTNNEVVALPATAANGYGFLRFIIGGTPSTVNPESVTMSADVSVTAKFAPLSVQIFNFDTSKGAGNYGVYNATTLGYEMTSIGTYFKGTSGGSVTASGNTCTYSGNSTSYTQDRTTSSSIFYFKLNQSISSMTIGGYSSSSGRTYNTIATSSTLNGTYTVVSDTHSGTIPSSGCYEISVLPTAVIAAGNYIKVTFNGNVTVNYIAFGCPPDATPPALSFSPANGASNVLLNATGTITSNEPLYIYDPVAFTYTAINAGTSNASLHNIVSLTEVVSGNPVTFTATASADGKTITVTPSSNFGYATQYKLSIANVSDQYNNIIPSAQYSTFTSRPPLNPIMSIKEINTTYPVIAVGGSYNMGTLFSAGTIVKTFKIFNTSGLDNLTLTLPLTFTGTNAGLFTVTTAPSATVLPGDSTTFVVTFNPGASTGNLVASLAIANNSSDKNPYTINFSAGKIAFVIPYTYESACTSPVYTSSQLKQDYTSLSDIPSQVSIGGTPVNSSHFYSSYNVFQVEGNCMPDGSSALRVGQGANSLRVAATSVGKVTVKWCANGYRKIRITDNTGNIYEQSSNYMIGGVCYTTATVVNKNTGLSYINIELIGPNASLLSTVYYLEITPYDATLKSSAKNIIDFSTTAASEKVRIYDDVVFVTVPSGTDITHITTDVLNVSPFATVSPALGGPLNYTGGLAYTVTAQDGTTKNYTVYVEDAIDYTTSSYADSIDITVPMNSKDQLLEVLEISNKDCTVPSSGAASEYTLHYLDSNDKPASYIIGGLTTVCVGSTVSYNITNAPATNNPSYIWKIAGKRAFLNQFLPTNSPFTYKNGITASPVDSTVDTLMVTNSLEVLTMKVPDVIVSANLSINISVVLITGCNIVNGTANAIINVTQNAPQPITGVTASCVDNDGRLTLTAVGASGSATTYNWAFSPAQDVVIQNGNSIVLNVGTGGADIGAQVTTQNGCGVTANNTSYNVDYATNQTQWIGGTSAVWDDNTNWTARKPKACTNVIIPDVTTVPYYPTIVTSGVCNDITFLGGGAVLGLEKLTYNRAFVKAELQRTKWYTLTAPLKQMFAGDYSFVGGSPVTDMRLFDTVNPDSISNGATNTGTWSKNFAAPTVSLSPASGFAYNINTKTYNYPGAITYPTTNVILEFPKLNADSTLVDTYFPYSTYSGRLLTPAWTVNKDPKFAYRFAAENGSNKLVDVSYTLKAGLNLVGNPLMTHLNFNALYADNSGVIHNKVKFWNGTTFTTYITGTALTSAVASSNGTGAIIPPMQSFFVESGAGGTLTFKLASHFVANKTMQLKSANISDDNVLHIVSNNGQQSTTAIAKRSDASNSSGDDDAFKLFSQFKEVPEVFTLADGRPLDINLFSKLPYTTPLGIRTTKIGKIGLQFDGAESFPDADVYLVNSLTGTEQNLKENPTYDFNYDGTNGEGTLFVEFRSASTVTDNKVASASSSDIQIYTKNGNIIRVISSPSDLIKEISVYDELGKLIMIEKDVNKSSEDIVMNNGKKVYMVRVITENKVKIGKVIIY